MFQESSDQAYKTINYSFSQAQVATQTIEALPVGNYTARIKTTLDETDYFGELQFAIEKGTTVTDTLRVFGNGTLIIVVRSTNNIPLGNAEVYLYASQEDRLNENPLDMKTTDPNTPNVGVSFKNLTFDDYSVKARWKSDPTSDWMYGVKDGIWVNHDEEKKISVIVKP